MEVDSDSGAAGIWSQAVEGEEEQEEEEEGTSQGMGFLAHL